MPVQFILNKLNDNGYEGFIVGGCVRDCLLGIKPHGKVSLIGLGVR